MQCYRCNMRMSVDGESYSCDCGYTIPINTANTAFYAQAAVNYAQAAVAEVQARGERIAELRKELAEVEAQRGHYCQKLGPALKMLAQMIGYVENLPSMSRDDSETRKALLEESYAAMRSKDRVS